MRECRTSVSLRSKFPVRYSLVIFLRDRRKQRKRGNLNLSFTFRERTGWAKEKRNRGVCCRTIIAIITSDTCRSPRIIRHGWLVMGSSSICAHESWWNSIRKFTLWDSVTTSVWDNVQLCVFTEYSGYTSYFWTRTGICRIRSNT